MYIYIYIYTYIVIVVHAPLLKTILTRNITSTYVVRAKAY